MADYGSSLYAVPGVGTRGSNVDSYKNPSSLAAQAATRKLFSYLSIDFIKGIGYDAFGNVKEPVITEKELMLVDKNDDNQLKKDANGHKNILKPTLSGYDLQIMLGKNPPKSAKDNPMSLYAFTTQVLGGHCDLGKSTCKATREEVYARLKSSPAALDRLGQLMGEKFEEK